MLPYFEVFGLHIPLFGLMMMLGILAGIALTFYTRRFIPFTEDQVLTALIWTILGGFIGSKLTYWCVEFKRILADPSFLLHSLREGFVLYGSLIGGVIGCIIYTRKNKLPTIAMFDLIAPSFAIGQAFGRIGCFCAGCCYGRPTHSCLGVVFPEGSLAPAGVSILPTQLFESIFMFLFTGFLIWLVRKKKVFGTVMAAYLLGYGTWRFIIEFFRDDPRGTVGMLSTSQFIGIFVILFGLVLVALIKKGVLNQDTLSDPADLDAERAEELFPEPEEKKEEES